MVVIEPDKMELTEEQKNKNYAYLLDTMSRLRAGIPITEDMETIDLQYFKGMRQMIGDFNVVYDHITNTIFRKKANETEQLARYLDMYICEMGHMEYTAYLQFLERSDFLSNFYEEPKNEMDDLMSSFKKTAIK